MSKYTSRYIFKLRDDWSDYMTESWERGRQSISFIEKSEQAISDPNDLSFDSLAFNFMWKLLKIAQSRAQEIDLSLLLHPLGGTSTEEDRTNRALFHQLMLNDSNKKAFKECLDKVYSFGQGVFQIKNVRQNQETLNEILEVKSVQDVPSVFFDKYAKSPTFSDGQFCGKTFKLSAARAKKYYPRLKNYSLKEEVELADCWYRVKKPATFLKLNNGQYKREDLIDPQRDSLAPNVDPRKDVITEVHYVRVVKELDIYLEKEKNFSFNMLPLVFNPGGMIWDASQGKYETFPFGWHLRDTQILLNYAGSVAADILKSTKADRFLLDETHLQSKEAMDSANEINQREGALLFTGNVETIKQIPSQQLPPQVGEMFMQLQGVLQTLAGSYFEQEADKIKGISGVALDKLFTRMDLAQNPVILAHLDAINQVGRVLQAMIPDYYYQQRLICLKMPDGTQEFTEINTPRPQPNGMVVIENNVKDIANKYEYNVQITSSPRLQKQNTQLELEKLYQIFPPAAQSTIDIYANSLDIPCAEILGKRLSVNIPPALIAYANGEMPESKFRAIQAQQQQAAQRQMMNSPQMQALGAKAAKDQADAQSSLLRSRTDAFNAQTNRLKEMGETTNHHIRSISDAVKVALENENTRYVQQVEIFKKLLEHLPEDM